MLGPVGFLHYVGESGSEKSCPEAFRYFLRDAGVPSGRTRPQFPVLHGVALFHEITPIRF